MKERIKNHVFSLTKKWFATVNRITPHFSRKKNIGNTKTKGRLLNKLIQSRLSHPPKIHTAKKDLRIACIMDEFTFHCFKFEAKLKQLTPANGIREIAHFKPDFLFIESAWYGVAKTWNAKVRNCSVELLALVKYCRANNIPTLFWNKEDPVHFSKFLNVAKIVDYVFTTDIDCIPEYKHYLGHDRVYLLPFAAQTKTHNPIEKYERKDAFNFAGSYNHRYPERQKDFDVIINTLKQYKSIDIYDRFYNSIHPYFVFPKKYAPYILGKLPFEEIDKAYKGYSYAINMNSVKQSQTMFARRVFELIASNTFVISNFSRGTRSLFGDLVIATDAEVELNRRLERLHRDEEYYRKLRLRGLRKVMQEHTYTHRLSYIHAKLSDGPFENPMPKVAIVAIVRNADQKQRLLAQFKKQHYKAKTLYCVIFHLKIYKNNDVSIRTFTSVSDCIKAIRHDLPTIDLVGQMLASDYYGPFYLTDLALASTYSDAVAFSKVNYYTAHQGLCALENNAKPYCQVFMKTASRRTLARARFVTLDELRNWLKKEMGDELKQGKVLIMDEFNYCQQGEYLSQNTLRTTVDDLVDINEGFSFEKDLAPIAESMRGNSEHSFDHHNFLEMDAVELYQLFNLSDDSPVTMKLNNEILYLKSQLDSNKHFYIYSYPVPKEEFNLIHKTIFKLECKATCGLKAVFEFQDEHYRKISYAMYNSIDKNCDIVTPSQCKFIRFGFRVYGPGRAKIYRLKIGSNPLLTKATVILGSASKLALTRMYPSYMKSHANAFLHKKVRFYRDLGLLVDVFCLKNASSQFYREYEGVDIATGNAQLLRATLNTGRYDTLFVHGMDEKMWQVLEPYLDQIKITLWLYGNEFQETVTVRRSFWKFLLTLKRENFKIKFITQHVALKMTTDLDIHLNDVHYDLMGVIDDK